MTAPLNILQRYMLKRQLADSASCLYVIPVCLRLRPEIDPARFAAAADRAAAAFEFLRARLEGDGRGGFVWRDTGRPPPPVRIVDASDADFIRLRDEARPFDLVAEPLARFAVIRTPSRGNWFRFDFHHLAADGYAILAFNRLLERVYDAPGAALPPDGAFARLAASAADERGPRFAAARAYWERTYADGGVWTTAPLADRTGTGTAQGELVFDLPVSAAGLRRRGRELELGPAQLAQAATLRALADDSGSARVLAGWSCHGRTTPELRNVGLPLMKDLVVGLDASLADGEFLRLLRARDNEALRASRCPWAVDESCPLPDEIVDVLWQGDMRSGAGQSRRLYMNDPDESDGYSVGSQNILDIEICAREERVFAYFDYSAARYSPERIAGFAERFRRRFAELLAS